jgi:hypothetical protein
VNGLSLELVGLAEPVVGQVHERASDVSIAARNE